MAPRDDTYPGDYWTFEHDGMTFRAVVEYDYDHGAPWDEHDGHGPVSGWTNATKRPGELVLDRRRGGERLYYDFAAACKIARRDGWDAAPYNKDGRETPRQQAAKAARADYERLRRWCATDWCWVGVIVTCEDLPDAPQESLWGIESDCAGYQHDVATELAEQIIHSAASEIQRVTA